MMVGPVNMAGEVRLPNLCILYIYFLRVPLHKDEHYHGAKLIYHDVWRTLDACFSMLGLVPLIVVYSEQL